MKHLKKSACIYITLYGIAMILLNVYFLFSIIIAYLTSEVISFEIGVLFLIELLLIAIIIEIYLHE